MAPLLWPEHKNFLNTLNEKNFKKNSGEGAQPLPETPSSVGRGHPLPTLHPIGASGASNLASLALPPLHKILNTPLVACSANAQLLTTGMSLPITAAATGILLLA